MLPVGCWEQPCCGDITLYIAYFQPKHWHSWIFLQYPKREQWLLIGGTRRRTTPWGGLVSFCFFAFVQCSRIIITLIMQISYEVDIYWNRMNYFDSITKSRKHWKLEMMHSIFGPWKKMVPFVPSRSTRSQGRQFDWSQNAVCISDSAGAIRWLKHQWGDTGRLSHVPWGKQTCHYL